MLGWCEDDAQETVLNKGSKEQMNNQEDLFPNPPTFEYINQCATMKKSRFFLLFLNTEIWLAFIQF